MRFPISRTTTSSRCGLLTRASQASTCYVGIDVGIDRVQVATLGPTDHHRQKTLLDSPLAWIARSEFPLPVAPNATPSPDWVDVVVDQLREHLPRCVHEQRNAAVISLPTSWIHYETCSDAGLAECQSRCDSMFAASIFRSQAHLSTWPIANGQRMIAATAESAACKIAEAVASVGYRVRRILPHGVALLHSATALTSLDPSAVLLLEWSGGLIAMASDNGCGLCRHLPAHDVENNACPDLHEIEPWLQEIASDVIATSRYSSQVCGTTSAESPLLVCGRAAEIDGVDEALAFMTGRPVAIWGFAGRHRPRQRSLDQRRVDARTAVALSLAYCGSCDRRPRSPNRKMAQRAVASWRHPK